MAAAERKDGAHSPNCRSIAISRLSKDKANGSSEQRPRKAFCEWRPPETAFSISCQARGALCRAHAPRHSGCTSPIADRAPQGAIFRRAESVRSQAGERVRPAVGSGRRCGTSNRNRSYPQGLFSRGDPTPISSASGTFPPNTPRISTSPSAMSGQTNSRKQFRS